MLFEKHTEVDEVYAEVFCNAFGSKFTISANMKSEALTTAAHIFRILLIPNITMDCDMQNTTAAASSFSML
jgi:hypothetical protein